MGRGGSTGSVALRSPSQPIGWTDWPGGHWRAVAGSPSRNHYPAGGGRAGTARHCLAQQGGALIHNARSSRNSDGTDAALSRRGRTSPWRPCRTVFSYVTASTRGRARHAMLAAGLAASLRRSALSVHRDDLTVLVRDVSSSRAAYAYGRCHAPLGASILKGAKDMLLLHPL